MCVNSRIVLDRIIILFLTVISAQSNNFYIKDEYAQMKDYNSTYLHLESFTFHKINRTTKVRNLRLTFNTDVTEEDDLEMHIKFFLLASNTYKRLFDFRTTYCQLLATGRPDAILKESNLNSCPVMKGRHYANNLIATSRGWPSVPHGRYKMEVDVSFRNELILTIQWMLEILPKVP